MILKTEFKNNIPRYYCSNCSKCTSHISINFTNLKHRGCCYYFPKFNLVDIQKMVQLPGGKNVLDKIIKEAKNQGYEFKSLDEFKNWIWNDLIYENTQKIKKSMRGKSSWKKEKLVKF